MFTHNTPAEPLRAPASRPMAAAITAMLLTAFIVIAIVVGSLLTAAPSPRTSATSEITDGWRAYLGAASTPRTTVDATDGWGSYLLAGSRSSDVTDGWLTRYGSR